MALTGDEVVQAITVSALVWVDKHFDEYAAELGLSGINRAVAESTIGTLAVAGGNMVLGTPSAQEFLHRETRKGPES